MNLQPIAEQLQIAGFGTVGVDIFRRNMPARVTRGLLVTEQMPVQINPYASRYYSGAFQIVARDNEYDAPYDLMNSVIDAISGEGMEWGGMKFRFIRARHMPLVYPKSESDLVEASVNFDVIFSM